LWAERAHRPKLPKGEAEKEGEEAVLELALRSPGKKQNGEGGDGSRAPTVIREKIY